MNAADAVDGDQVFTMTYRDATHVHDLTRKFSKELNQKCHDVKPLGKPFCLAEIFCSEQSPLTHQMQQLREGALRFGYAHVILPPHPGETHCSP